MDRRSLGQWPTPTVIILVLAMFTAGVALERYGWLPGSHSHEPPGLGSTFAPFWEAWHLVQEYYVDQSAVNPQHMTDGAIEGMLDSLGDRGHTTYLTKDEFHQMETSLQGQMEGIGARMTMHDHLPTVAGILPNSPAQRAGLRAGDVFMEVDGKDVRDLSLERLVALVRGPAGTKVHIKLLRDNKPVDVDITRAKVEVPSVTWHLLPGTKVAHVALQEFGKSAHDQMVAALEGAAQAGARGLLVDVRGNPGGLKEQAVAVTSLFLEDGVVFIEQDGKGNRKPVPVQPQKERTALPLVVLIDGGTASSAEIFSGAIQDHKRGELVGTKTYGTGTVLMPFELKDGSAVLLAVSEWLTPDGRRIWHEGIKPDVEVSLPVGARILLPEAEGDLTAAQLAKSEDKQLLKGLDVLKQKLQAPSGTAPAVREATAHGAKPPKE
ncbi:MAG TPA: S41 family peptidase [Gemmataceae bacterium]|nr:S41 family peptidase [Gemmataceae bacterium]